MARKTGRSEIYDDNFIMSPKVDFAFKLLFGDSNNIALLQSLLSSILNISKEELNDLKIINNELPRQFAEDKKGILDVRAKTKDKKEIDIEIQVLSTDYMAERTTFYWSKMYTSQIKSGDTYDKLKKCITINIVDFECIPLNKIHTSYHITEDETGYKLTDILEIHYLELPKLDKKDVKKDENTAIIQWMEFIGAKSKEVMEMLASKNKDIKEAYDKLQIISKDEESRMAYEAREAEIHDQMTRLKAAREEGITQGAAEKAVRIAENLLKMGLTVEQVASASELTKEKVIELKKKYQN
ncbi:MULTISPECIES: Rpn family recombination-promoting nuclease/putative transposase [Clostridium]|uniref:Rpn family recombination-promoting nuclease/putative transposase n=1 Tax=Clostridium TaxID=1485 RepID=UPI0008272078|nr:MULTISPECIES: Rpn family recombination-promoting nuclease/putative transposase [Clostridium]PJI10439.1 transposase [Clostridium sp. CT7]